MTWRSLFFFPARVKPCLLLICWGLLSPDTGLAATPVFTEGFESGSLESPWSATATQDGRAVIVSEFEPASGQRHLVLDDSQNDNQFSVAEATLTLDLTGHRKVVLTFKCRSLGNEPHSPPFGTFLTDRHFDGVSVSLDGGSSWRTVQTLATVDTQWKTFVVDVDAALGLVNGGYGANVKIRFSAYDNVPAPEDGLAIDDVLIEAEIDPRIIIEVPSPVAEGSQNLTGRIRLSVPVSSDLAVALTSSNASQLSLPPGLVIPAGLSAVDFTFHVADDAALNLTRTVSLTASAAGFPSSVRPLIILDNEQASISLALPTEVTEGESPSNNASISIQPAPAVPLRFTLTASPPAQLSFPATVTIQAGQSQARFALRAVNDVLIETEEEVELLAVVEGLAPVSGRVRVIDDESNLLSLVSPHELREGRSNTIRVQVAGNTREDVVVTINSSPDARIILPPSVVIRAGQSEAIFTVRVPENTVAEKKQQIVLSATAAGFVNKTVNLWIHDNDAAGYRIDPIPELVTLESPWLFGFHALDLDGDRVNGVSSSLQLSLELPDGSVAAPSPSAVTLANDGWSGMITLPAVEQSPVRLKVTDANGLSAVTSPFEVMRTIDLIVEDLVWDGRRGRLYASVPSRALRHANSIVAIDPLTLKIMAVMPTGLDPGRLAMAAEGDTLYVAMNGDAAISMVGLDSFRIAKTFAVGQMDAGDPLFAEDMVPVAGQPTTLVVARGFRGQRPGFHSLAAYDYGVPRPVTLALQDGHPWAAIEPSGDPSLIFLWNQSHSGPSFFQVRLDALGLVEAPLGRVEDIGNAIDFRSAGNRVFSNSGFDWDVGSAGPARRMEHEQAFMRVAPDLEHDRLYVMRDFGPDEFTWLRVVEASSHHEARAVHIWPPLRKVRSLTRWDPNGLAFATENAVVIIRSQRLVPDHHHADLVTKLQGFPDPIVEGAPVTLVTTVTNQGPEPARSVEINFNNLQHPAIRSVKASAGGSVQVGKERTNAWWDGQLPVGASVSLSIELEPPYGSILVEAHGSSSSLDPDIRSNRAVLLLGQASKLQPDTTEWLLGGVAAVHDSQRNVIWICGPGSRYQPKEAWLFSLDPMTGKIIQLISTEGTPAEGCLKLSPNGRYLYMGMADAVEVARVDLSASPPLLLKIPLVPMIEPLGLNHPSDLEILDGPGTSFLVTGQSDHTVTVFDGPVARPLRLTGVKVARIARGAAPDEFVGVNWSSSPPGLSRIRVTAEGVELVSSMSWVGQMGAEIVTEGSLGLLSTGEVVNLTSLAVVRRLGARGIPCLDVANRRAFLVDDRLVGGFDLDTGGMIGPKRGIGEWGTRPTVCVRWGWDGLSVVGSSFTALVRWSELIPAERDSDQNGVPDRWQTLHLGPLGGDVWDDLDGDGMASGFEYLLGTDPGASSPDPRRVAHSPPGVIVLEFPRRTGLASNLYGFESPSFATLTGWTDINAVRESVVRTEVINGVEVETISAEFQLPDPRQGFVRMKWRSP